VSWTCDQDRDISNAYKILYRKSLGKRLGRSKTLRRISCRQLVRMISGTGSESYTMAKFRTNGVKLLDSANLMSTFSLLKRTYEPNASEQKFKSMETDI
jgi:hypothetical protein